LLPAGVMDEMEISFNLVHDTGRKQHEWTIWEAVKTVKCSWWWAKTSPEICRADWVQINKSKVVSCWSSVTNYLMFQLNVANTGNSLLKGLGEYFLQNHRIRSTHAYLRML
jgi:hypothetical protein